MFLIHFYIKLSYFIDYQFNHKIFIKLFKVGAGRQGIEDKMWKNNAAVLNFLKNFACDISF